MPIDAQIRALAIVQDIFMGRRHLPERGAERDEMARRLDAIMATLIAIEPVQDQVRALLIEQRRGAA